MEPKIVVYSDYVCPFCFIGKSLADRLEKQFGIEAVWKGFEIHPEIPPGGCDLKSLGFSDGRAAAMFSRIAQLADEAGLRLEPQARISNTHLALQVAEFAKERGRFREYHKAVFEAYWQRGKDIGDRTQLFSIAAKAGLDLKELEAYLKSGKADVKLEQYLREVHRYGIDGVPTFFIGNKMVVGAQPYEVLEAAVKEELIKA
jgi:predicted DsbA family dithiol-disulfide isomerase